MIGCGYGISICLQLKTGSANFESLQQADRTRQQEEEAEVAQGARPELASVTRSKTAI